MAHDDDDRPRHPSGIVDLKTALGGAGALIVLLAGATWGLVNANHTDEVERNQSTNAKQWERLKELNDGLIKLESKMEQAVKYIDDQEDRIRALEHRGERR